MLLNQSHSQWHKYPTGYVQHGEGQVTSTIFSCVLQKNNLGYAQEAIAHFCTSNSETAEITVKV
jgi:hypothetical protein